MKLVIYRKDLSSKKIPIDKIKPRHTQVSIRYLSMMDEVEFVDDDGTRRTLKKKEK